MRATSGKIMEIHLTEIENLLHKIGRKNAKDTNQYFRDFWDIFHNRPERLTPEDNFDDYLKDPGKYFRRMEDNLLKEIICDSPTPDNKENQGGIEKSMPAICATCDFPSNDGKRRIYCMCGQ